MSPRYNIGTQYLTRGKWPRLCTVIDILTTTNSAGEVIKIRYMATHKVLEQMVTDYDVCDATIAIGKQLLERSA